MKKLSNTELKKTLSFIKRIVKESSGIIIQGQLKKQKMIKKDDGSYTTGIDLKVEKFLKKQLRTRFPMHNIIGEELAQVDKASLYSWHIDPIDGTYNFQSGIPFYSVSIGLCYKDKPILGVVYNPITKELYSGVKGEGAYLKTPWNPTEIQLKLKKSTSVSLNMSIFSATTLPKREGKLRSRIEKLNKKTLGALAKRRFGCASLEMCYVASGKLDAYWSRQVKSWDIAAAFVICEEANCSITDIYGQEPTVFSNNIIVSRSGLKL